jgi:thiol:disulfide interchange protein DsbD
MTHPFSLACRKVSRAVVFGLLASILAGSAGAKPWWLRGSDSNEADFLPPDVAFMVGATVEGEMVRVRWRIADGYYLYRNKIEVKAESPDLTVAAPILPAGSEMSDQFLGTQRVFFQQAEAIVPFQRSDFGAHPIQIKVTYQGCAKAGLCYPPISKVLFPAGATMPGATTPGAAAAGAAGADAKRSMAWESTAILGGGFAFVLAGLVLRKGRRLPMPSP